MESFSIHKEHSINDITSSQLWLSAFFKCYIVLIRVAFLKFKNLGSLHKNENYAFCNLVEMLVHESR